MSRLIDTIIPDHPLLWEALAKLVLATIFGFFCWRAWMAYQLNPNWNLVLLMVSEGLTTILLLAAKMPTQRNTRPLAVMLALTATLYFVFIRLDSGTVLVPAWASQGLQVMGLAFQITAKLWLGRSFGLLPAHRGIVSTGPYRVVRHPIYLGYLISHIGFFLSMFSLYNAVVFGLLYLLQIGRILEEEKVLRTDPEYRAFQRRTRYRLLPFVF